MPNLQLHARKSTASELILDGNSGRRGEARMAESGDGVLGRGQPTELGGLRERCKLPQRGPRGRAPAAERFSCILSRQIAFPSITYVLHTVCMNRY